jgi:hypothetical protein
MSFPDVSDAFWGLTEPTRFQVATRVPVDYEASETLAPPVTFDGILQPETTQKLLVKPEGERRWKWFRLYTTQELALGDAVTAYDGKTYQVMSKDDWSQGGHFAYELTERSNVHA